MIKNGIIQENNIFGIPFKVDLIPKSNKTSRPGYSLKPNSITIHNTGNKQKNANALMHTKYVDETKNYVSWHFTVDDKCIYQELPINENAWHATDGREGKGNRTSIAIEICEHEGINWTKAKDNAIKLVFYLFDNAPSLKQKSYNGHVVPHQHWHDKYCPHRILDEGWSKFMGRFHVIKQEIYKIKEKDENWKQKLGEEAINYLDKFITGDLDLLTTPKAWKNKDLIHDKTDLWLLFVMLSRVMKYIRYLEKEVCKLKK